MDLKPPSGLRSVLSPIKRYGYVTPVYLVRKFVRLTLLKEREIKLLCLSGLANRLSTLAGTIVDAEDLDVRLRLQWPNTAVCGAYFNDLFINRIDGFEGRYTRTDQLDDPHAVCPANPGRVPLAWIRDLRISRAWTVDGFAGDSGLYRRRFTKALLSLIPQSNISCRLMEIPPATVGVHVRRTDLPFAHLSSNDWFFNQVDLLLNNTNINFIFLCSDDPQVKKSFSCRYGNRLLQYEIILKPDRIFSHRNSSCGIKDALLDLLTLSKTELVIGTYNSSFSWLASIWGDVPLYMSGMEKNVYEIIN